MKLYQLAEKMSNTTTFKYATIIVVLLIFFRTKYIGLNIFLALILALVVIAYIQDKNDTKILHEETEKEHKLDSIKPKPENFKGHDDIVDFVYSVQDLYDYNPLAFEEMVDNLDVMLEIRTLLEKGVKNCEHYYQIAENKKNNALNSLHSLIFTIPTSKRLTDKLDRGHKRLETVLNKYLNYMYDICYHDTVKNGYNVERIHINLGPKAHNHYFDRDFTYQIY